MYLVVWEGVIEGRGLVYVGCLGYLSDGSGKECGVGVAT